MSNKETTPAAADAASETAQPGSNGQVKKPEKMLAAKTPHFAHRHILHGSKVITRGSELPADFPDASTTMLLESNAVATTRPEKLQPKKR